MQRIFPKAPKIPEPPGGCQAIARRILDKNITAVIWQQQSGGAFDSLHILMRRGKTNIIGFRH
jgi:hypothetical protein